MDAPLPSFFRVILPSMLEKKKLVTSQALLSTSSNISVKNRDHTCLLLPISQKLPLKFVKMHGSELSSTAALTLPNGQVWNVGVEKATSDDKEEIWLGDGWGEFVAHHSIFAGFFVVFEYQLGRSAFAVSIFDFTTCSIEYPKSEQLDEEQTGSPHCIVISSSDEEDEGDCEPITRNKLRPRRRQPSDLIMTPEMEKTLECLEASGIATRGRFHLMLPKVYRKCKKGIEEAIACKPEDRPCFIAVLTSNQIRGSTRTTIPTWFGREHKIERGCKRSGILVVCNGEKAGEQWRVDLARSALREEVFMGKGWGRFMEDNSLGEGDVCLFQLVSSEDPVKMDVSIFTAQPSDLTE
ncbi:unnamed protein product [Linum tenue]|uniref:TF-B3 domain-containing protein n=1 Tax=Linum tenue TaxID=586396 RepID=A0AAV0HEZ7_9ROSI|nr:unnamed protein product [Linum tenue]